MPRVSGASRASGAGEGPHVEEDEDERCVPRKMNGDRLTIYFPLS